MDVPATQVYDDEELSAATQRTQNSQSRNNEQIAMLIIDSVPYPIYRGVNVVGRHPTSNIVLNDPTVSKSHAEIEASRNQSWICDLNSSNKTRLNDVVLRPSRCYEFTFGSTVEFGKVRAIYKSVDQFDDSIIPPTPAPNKKNRLIIPGTPDTSQNDSSVAEADASTIPGTQTENQMFLRPSLPTRYSADKKKKFVGDSSLEESMEKSQNSKQQTNESSENVSIHDMETQKFVDSSNVTDIHDMETQDVFNMPTQIVVNEKADKAIHDKTAHESRKEISAANINRLSETRENKDDINICNAEEQNIKNNDQKQDEQEMNNDILELCSQDFRENFVDEDVSLNASQNLLQNYFDASPPRESSCSLNNSTEKSEDNIFDAATQIVTTNDNVATHNESKTSERSEKTAVESSDSETDNEIHDKSKDQSKIIFKSSTIIQYHRNKNEDDKDASDSDGSITDEEGRFTELARRQSSVSTPTNSNQTADKNNTVHDDSDDSTRDSIDIFEVATQRISNESVEKSTRTSFTNSLDVSSEHLPKATSSLNKTESDESEKNNINKIVEIDDLAPTQIIFSANADVLERKEKDVTEIDDMAPTQLIIPKADTDFSDAVSAPSTSKLNTEEEKDITELDDTSPTQLISQFYAEAKDQTETSKCDVGVEEDITELNDTSPAQLISQAKTKNLAETSKCDVVEDLAYETAPTQLVSEVESSNSKKETESRKSGEVDPKKTHLEDSLEKNLNEMFDEVNDKEYENSSVMSTQCLADVLEPTQKESTPRKLKDAENVTNKIGSNCTSVVSKDVKKSTSTPNTDKKTRSIHKINLSDSLEQNLNDMFEEVNDGSIEIPSHLSTQCLESILEPTQNFESPSASDLQNKSKKKLCTPSNKMSINYQASSRSTRSAKSIKKRSEIDNTESKNSNACFSNLTPKRRKLNFVKDSPEKSPIESAPQVEQISEDKIKESAEIIPGTSVQNLEKMEDSDDSDIAVHLVPIKILGTLSNPGSPDTSLSNRRKNTRKGKTSSRNPRKQTTADNTSLDLDVTQLQKLTDRLFAMDAMLEKQESTFLKKRLKQASNKSETNRPVESINTPTNTKDMEKKINEDTSSCANSVRKSPLLQNIKELRSDKSDDESSCVFQVANEVSSGHVTSKSTRRNTAIRTRGEKRSITNKQEESGVKRRRTSNVKRPKGAPEPAVKEKSTSESQSDTKEDISLPKRRRTAAKDINTKPVDKTVPVKPKKNNPRTRNVDKNTGISNIKNFLIQKESPRNTPNQKSPKNMGGAGAEERRSLTPIVLLKPIDDKKNDAKFQVPTPEVKRKRGRPVGRRNAKKDSEPEDIPSKINRRQTKATMSDVSYATTVESSEDSQEIQSILQNASPPSTRRTNRRGKSKDKSTEFLSTPRTKRSNALDLGEASTRSRSRSATNTSSEIGSNSSENSSVLSTQISHRSSFLASSPLKIKYRVVFTGINRDPYEKILKKLGLVEVTGYGKCDVVITDKVRRTMKFLCALGQGIPIVSIEWINDSEAAGSILDLENYILKDPAAEAKFGFRLRKSLEKAKAKKLLQGYTIILTPNVAPPPIAELKSMITSCGGKPLVRAPTKWEGNIVIVTREEDIVNAKKFLMRAPEQITFQSTEFILSGILKQELDFNSYRFDL